MIKLNWIDDFNEKAMFVLTTKFVPIALMVVGHSYSSFYFVVCCLFAFALMIAGEYLK